MKQLLTLLLLALATNAQEQKRLAILSTEDDGEPPMEFTDLKYLTARLREIAVKTLPKNNYSVMTEQNIIDKTGSKENAAKACKEAKCLADLGRKISADYVGQARLGRFSGNLLTINMELYNSASGSLTGSFTGEAKDVSGLLAVLNEEAPALFKKMPGASGGSKISSPVAGGISSLEKAIDYELDERFYLANLSTEPSGAILSFDGVPSASCPKTPCKTELPEGSVRIIAALEQYETADTTVSVFSNNQNIAITLKPNFGILEIKPAYLDGIGEYSKWNLTVNDKAYNSFENRFSPGNYNVKLSHKCYEVVSFIAGINKGKREVFDMAGNITLKKGGLILSAERSGEPASEPVFVNGRRAGETPFSNAVPLCSKVEIGENMETVDVILKYNEKVRYTYRSRPLEIAEIYTPTPELRKQDKTFLFAIALDVLGAAFISYAVYENGETKKAYNEYKESGHPSGYYEDAWKKTESSRSKRNTFYVIGSTALASGVGVHILF